MTMNHASADRLQASMLAEQFERPEQQREAATLGMWVFLATEVLFFGGLFAAYTVGRILYPDAFAAASRHTDVLIGSINTALLLTSSLTMALAVRAGKQGHSRAITWLLLATLLLGLGFLGLKGVEYTEDFHEHLVPALNISVEGPYEPQQELFFILYFLTTGLHAIHVTVGVCVIGALIAMNIHGRFSKSYYTPVEIGGLYWHFVDIVWIFLYPLLYLVARA